MYNQLVIFCAALAASATLAHAGKCSDHLLSLKSDNWDEESTSYDFTACSAVFSTFERHLPQVHGLINEHIAQSFLYSIMSSHFETDSENRLGFGKYLDGLADSMWSDAIDLVKYAGKRGGGVAPLIDDEKTGLRIADLNAGIKPWTEVEALALVYDHHNSLAGRIHQLHGSTRDTAFSDYLEGRFVSNHVDRIRQLAGYMTNLVPMYQEASGSDLALYLFDQSLV